MEFQNGSSGCPSPVTPFWYSDTRISRRGNKAAHHLSEKSSWHRFRIKSSAFRRNNCQSSAEPSMITDGNPHKVVHLKEKKLFVISMTVIFKAMFSTSDVSEKPGDSSAARPSTTLRSICDEKQSGLPSTTEAQLFFSLRQNSSHLTSNSFLPSWATHFARISSAFCSTWTAVACSTMGQKCCG